MLRTLPSCFRPGLASTAAVLITAALLVGCGKVPTGDTPSPPLGSKVGNGARIADYIEEAAWVDPDNDMSTGCTRPVDKKVFITGVAIGAIDRYDETGKGAIGNYYVQDIEGMGEPYSGVTFFNPSFSPPDLRLAQGDVVDLLGNFTEFPGPSSGSFPYCRTLPEITGAMSFRFDDNGAIVPTEIQVEELKTYEGARPYLGMVVKVVGNGGVKIVGAPSESGGRYTADLDVGGGIPASDVPRISNELFDLKNEGPELKDGTTFKSVTGVITYFYGFKVAPRSIADFELP